MHCMLSLHRHSQDDKVLALHLALVGYRQLTFEMAICRDDELICPASRTACRRIEGWLIHCSANLTTSAAMSEGAVCSVLLGPASDPLQRQDRLLRRNSQVCAPLLLGSAQSSAV